jgi:uncharacterized protein (TIGR02271 family)
MAKVPSKKNAQETIPLETIDKVREDEGIVRHDPYLEQPTVTALREETLAVNKSWVKAGEVQLRKQIKERTEEVPVELAHEEVDIQRVAVNRVLGDNERAEPRQEGDTLVVPVVEEELVVTKRMVVREEVRITKRQVTTQHTASDTLKREELVIDTSGDLTATNEGA